MLIWIKDTPTSWRLCKSQKTKIKSVPEVSTECGCAVPRFIIPLSVRQSIQDETLASPRKETGGILVGFADANSVQITAASGPGSRAVRTRSMFLRDKDYCSQFLNEHYQRSGADYVGDWHSHVGKDAPTDLSPGDIGTLTNVLHDPDYSDLPFFAVILSLWSGNPRSPVDLKGFIARRDWIGLVPLEE